MTLRQNRMDLLSARDYWAEPEPTWKPLPHQIPPLGNWDVWLLLGGRGSGKTMAGTHYVLDHLREFRKKARVGIGAPTMGDVRDVCAEGITGLMSLAPNEFRYNRWLSEAHHIDGGYVKFLGSEEPSRWNGPQWSLLWADELALWKEPSWHQAQFGLRLGEHPRAIVTTTPKNRKFVRELSELESTATVRATTYDNPTLSKSVQERLHRQYGNTRLGRQEILAEWLDDVPGALWRITMFDKRPDPPPLKRVAIAIDPAGGDKPESDETGIIVGGIGIDGNGYVLQDLSGQFSPDGWANRAIDAYDRHEADFIIAEMNFGGQMVEHTLRTVRRNLPIKKVTASRGKFVRAQPVAALYEQGRIFHSGYFQRLEEQLTQWTPEMGYSPDRLDALVWLFTELMVDAKETHILV
jgi:predicted phage terminase large subunit-like protein